MRACFGTGSGGRCARLGGLTVTGRWSRRAAAWSSPTTPRTPTPRCCWRRCRPQRGLCSARPPTTGSTCRCDASFATSYRDTAGATLAATAAMTRCSRPPARAAGRAHRRHLPRGHPVDRRHHRRIPFRCAASGARFGVPIIPVAMMGTADVLPKDGRFSPPAPMRVRLGAPGPHTTSHRNCAPRLVALRGDVVADAASARPPDDRLTCTHRPLPVVPSPRPEDVAQHRLGSVARAPLLPSRVPDVGHGGVLAVAGIAVLISRKPGTDPEMAHLGADRPRRRLPHVARPGHHRSVRRGTGHRGGDRVRATGQVGRADTYVLVALAVLTRSRPGSPVAVAPRAARRAAVRAALGARWRRRERRQAHRFHRFRIGVDLLVAVPPRDGVAGRLFCCASPSRPPTSPPGVAERGCAAWLGRAGRCPR